MSAPLDTLAQPRKVEGTQPSEVDARHVRRARAKAIGLPLMTELTELRGELEQSYRNSIYCASTYVQEHGQISSSYCKNRWCAVCSRIRMAEMIRQYVPTIEQYFEDPHFLTLTVRAVEADQLSERMDAMLKVFNRIKDKLRKQCIKVVAIRKLEANANPSKATYNPHYHLIIDGKRTAELVLEDWMDRWGDEAQPQSQDLQECYGEPGEGLKELLKYQTKVTTKTEDGRSVPVPTAMLDTIYRALRGRRTVQPIGCKVVKIVEDEGELPADEPIPETKRIGEMVVWEWIQALRDWIDLETGEVLSGYEPSDEDEALIRQYRSEQPQAVDDHGRLVPQAAADVWRPAIAIAALSTGPAAGKRASEVPG